MENKELQVIRLWSPLFPKLYPRDEDGDMSDCQIDLSSADIVEYQEKIEKVIQDAELLSEGGQGLAAYLDEGTLEEKVISIVPSVDVYHDQLWAIAEIQIQEELTEEEYSFLQKYMIGQYSDGWGECIEQRPIETEEGDLHVSFWSFSNEFFIKREEEMLTELSKSMEMMMG